MIIISDTTPLHYLIEIEEQCLLRKLFGQIILPQGVIEELSHPKAPQKVKDWVQNLPDWIEVRTADTSLFQPQKKIGKGECHAIALAIEMKADAVLADDRGAVLEARRVNVQTIQTLGILEAAAKRNLLELEEALTRLQQTNFYVLPEIIEALLARHRLFKQSSN